MTESEGAGPGPESPGVAGIAAAVWAFAGRSLDTIANIVAGVWANPARTLSAPTNLTDDNLAINNTLIDAAVTTRASLAAQTTMQADVTKIPKSDGAVTWNATALASIEAEVIDALTVQLLDHLVSAADGAGAFPASPVNNSIISKMLVSATPADVSTFVNTTMSLQALRAAHDLAYTNLYDNNDKYLIENAVAGAVAGSMGKLIQDIEHHVHHNSINPVPLATQVSLQAGAGADTYTAAWVEIVTNAQLDAVISEGDEVDATLVTLLDPPINTIYGLKFGYGDGTPGGTVEVGYTTINTHDVQNRNAPYKISVLPQIHVAGGSLYAKLQSDSGSETITAVWVDIHLP